ncbi:MAG: HTH domain-containing protein [Clostridium sp.]
MDVKEKVLEVLKNSAEPLKGGQIAEISGIDKKEIDKAIKALKTEGKIDSPKRCFYGIAE